MGLGQTVPPPNRPNRKDQCNLPGIPVQRIHEAVDASAALPASLGADAMIRIAKKVSPYCPVLAKELLRRAIDQGSTVKLDTDYKRAAKSYPSDSRITSQQNGFDLQVDRLSLESLSVQALATIDAKTAIQLFERIPAPSAAVAGCSNAFVPDLSIYYKTLEGFLQLLQRQKPRNDTESQEGFVKMEEVVRATTSPVQLVPLAETLEKASFTGAQFSMLLGGLATSVNSFPVDDRSLAADEYFGDEKPESPMNAIARLVTLSRRHKIAAYPLVQAYRDYLDRSMTGVHCEDNLEGGAAGLAAASRSLDKQLSVLAPGIERISTPESNPATAPGPAEEAYWLSPKTKALLIDGVHINFDDNGRRFSDADRNTPEWRDRVQRLLDHMEDWRADDEKDPGDYSHQRCMSLYNVLPYLSLGALHDRVISMWIVTLEESPLQWDSPAEWDFEVLRFLRFSKKSEKEPVSAEVMAALKNSSNGYLRASGVLAEFLQ
jgi:hypothetical protein